MLPLPQRANTRRAPDGAEPIVFLGQGALIEDVPIAVDERRARYAPGTREGLRLLARNGWRIAVMTDRSRLALSGSTTAELDTLDRDLTTMVDAAGAQLVGLYPCGHLAGPFAIEGDCQEPAAGLLARAALDIGADLAASWFVGARWTDVVAHRSAGCRTAVIGSEWRSECRSPDGCPDLAAPDLLAVAQWIGRRPQQSG